MDDVKNENAITDTMDGDNNGAVRRGVVSAAALLLALLAFEYTEKSGYIYPGPLILVLVVIPSTLFLIGAALKLTSVAGLSPPGRDARRFLGLVLSAAVYSISELISRAAVFRDVMGYRPGDVVYIIAAAASALLLRSIFSAISYRVTKGMETESPWRLAVGYADAALLLIGAILIYVVFDMPIGRMVRIAATLLIVGGIRVSWAYIPEDRLLVVREFIQFLGERRLWWMTPIFIVMGLLVVLVMLTQTTGGSFPFIYAIF